MVVLLIICWQGPISPPEETRHRTGTYEERQPCGQLFTWMEMLSRDGVPSRRQVHRFVLEKTMRSAVGRWEARLRVAMDLQCQLPAISMLCIDHIEPQISCDPQIGSDTRQCRARGAQLTLHNAVQRAVALPSCLRHFSWLFPKKKRWTCLLEGAPSLLSIFIHGKSCPDGRLSSYVPVRCRVSPGGAMDSSLQKMSKTTKTHIFCKRTHYKEREAQRTASDRVLREKVGQGTRHKKRATAAPWTSCTCGAVVQQQRLCPSALTSPPTPPRRTAAFFICVHSASPEKWRPPHPCHQHEGLSPRHSRPSHRPTAGAHAHQAAAVGPPPTPLHGWARPSAASLPLRGTSAAR